MFAASPPVPFFPFLSILLSDVGIEIPSLREDVTLRFVYEQLSLLRRFEEIYQRFILARRPFLFNVVNDRVFPLSLSHYLSPVSLSLALSFYVFVGPALVGGALQSISKSDDARPARRRHRLLYLLLIILSALAFQSVPSLRRNRQPFTRTWSRNSQPGPPSGDRYLSREAERWRRSFSWRTMCRKL